MATGLSLMAPDLAQAQKWSIEPSVSSELEWTSNAAFGETGARGDTIVDVRPRIRLLGEGAQIKFSGTAGLAAVAYVNRTQPSRILPEADLTASLEAVQRFLFIDAGLRASQTSVDPFGARAETGTTSENSVTTTQARLTPRIEGTTQGLRYLVRSDNTLTYESGATASIAGSSSAGYFGRHSASFEQDAKPFGWRFEAERSETRYRDTTQVPLVLDVARATLNYAVVQDLIVGVHVGRERTSFATQGSIGNIYGTDLKWQPSPRITFTGFEEKRFFGSAWRLAFDYRTPSIAMNLISTRDISTSPQTLFDLPATDNVAALLDAIYTTRFPDPAQRALVVQDLIARQGLPTSTLQPITLRAQRLSVVNQTIATVALIGVRNTIALSAFQTRTEDAAQAPEFATGDALTNNTQYGASLSLTHQLAPTLAVTAAADWSRIRALEGLGNQQTRQSGAQVRLNVTASPRTNAYALARYRNLDSNTSVSGREASVAVGVDHRF
jgi:uncharacterized protein (PEP-CTERM system associated)